MLFECRNELRKRIAYVSRWADRFTLFVCGHRLGSLGVVAGGQDAGGGGGESSSRGQAGARPRGHVRHPRSRCTLQHDACLSEYSAFTHRVRAVDAVAAASSPGSRG